MKRRQVIVGGALSVWVLGASGQSAMALDPKDFVFDIEPLVDNGNSVPISVRIASPMTESDHVQSIRIFAEKNPNPEVAVFNLSPANAVAHVSTRMRLATSQRVVVEARIRGDIVVMSREIIVTVSSCIEEMGM